MQKNQNEYLATRYSLIQEKQITMEGYLNQTKTKEELFSEWLLDLSERNKQEITMIQDEYIIYCKAIDSEKFILNFAKKTYETIGKKTEKEIRDETVENYIPFYIILNKKNQVMFIQKKNEFSTNISTQRNNIEKVINAAISKTGYTIKIDFITEKSDFWNYVRENKGSIKSLNITLTAPNFLKGISSVREFLSDLKSTYNNTETKISLSNEKGNLNVPEDNKFLKDAVSYSSSGCGSWKIKTTKSTKAYSNEDATVSEIIDISSMSNLTQASINKINSAFAFIDKIDASNISGDD